MIELYQEDAVSWLSSLEDGSVDLVITDPPMNLWKNIDRWARPLV